MSISFHEAIELIAQAGVDEIDELDEELALAEQTIVRLKTLRKIMATAVAKKTGNTSPRQMSVGQEETARAQIQRACKLAATIIERGPLRYGDVSTLLGIPAGSTHRVLAYNGWFVKEAGCYALSSEGRHAYTLTKKEGAA